MKAHRLALRHVMQWRARSVGAVLVIAVSLCALDLYAGRSASIGAALETRAVIGERLGHLTILHKALGRDGQPQDALFKPAEAVHVRQLVEAYPGVMLVLPQLSVHGVASNGLQSSQFVGEGIMLPTPRSPLEAAPGKLSAAVRNGVALGRAQARTLGVRNGSSLSLSAFGADGAAQDAEVVDVYDNPGTASLLMPFEFAQTLQGTDGTERFVVFLSDPARLEQSRAALSTLLRVNGIDAELKSWQELSATYAQLRPALELTFAFAVSLVLILVGVTVFASSTINVCERRAELATLRALGMRSWGSVALLVGEALWTATLGIALSMCATGVIAWIVNRAGSDAIPPASLQRAPSLVELDYHRMLLAVAAVLVLTLLAAALPAWGAARARITNALAGQPDE